MPGHVRRFLSISLSVLSAALPHTSASQASPPASLCSVRCRHLHNLHLISFPHIFDLDLTTTTTHLLRHRSSQSDASHIHTAIKMFSLRAPFRTIRAMPSPIAAAAATPQLAGRRFYHDKDKWSSLSAASHQGPFFFFRSFTPFFAHIQLTCLILLLDHYSRPRNPGSMDKKDPAVGTGLVGAPACGDVMKLQIRVDETTGTITDAKFKTFGCGSAIASSSYLTELVKGMRCELYPTLQCTSRGTSLSLET